jgi:hypothetical protein
MLTWRIDWRWASAQQTASPSFGGPAAHFHSRDAISRGFLATVEGSSTFQKVADLLKSVKIPRLNDNRRVQEDIRILPWRDLLKMLWNEEVIS